MSERVVTLPVAAPTAEPFPDKWIWEAHEWAGIEAAGWARRARELEQMSRLHPAVAFTINPDTSALACMEAWKRYIRLIGDTRCRPGVAKRFGMTWAATVLLNITKGNDDDESL